MKKIFISLVVVVIVLAVSCKKDNSQQTLSPTDPSTALNQSTTSISSDVSTLDSNSGYQAINNLTTLTTPFGNPLKSTVKITKALKAKSVKKSLKLVEKSGDYDFASSKGVWNYIPNSQTFSLVGSSKYCVINFPADSANMNVNNATVVIYNYTVGAGADSVDLTALSVDIYVNKIRQLSISYSANYNSVGTLTGLNTTDSIGNYVFTATYTSSGLTYAINLNLSKTNTTIIAVNGTFVYLTDTSSEPNQLNGYFQLYNTKITGSASNLVALSAIASPTAADVNADVHFTIVQASTNDLIATLKAFDATSTTAAGYYLVFSDGSKEIASQYYASIESKLPSSVTGLLGSSN